MLLLPKCYNALELVSIGGSAGVLCCCSDALLWVPGSTAGILTFKSNCDNMTWRDHLVWGHLPRVSIPLCYLRF